ncbi:hypothetical protein [Telluribacter humicola]|uniref:hypothetical protein n=1 Tax=Telluribacter humicola TaxID=1720261 RepID=UPI001A970F66|nr:hypothetical protein [Telluribacter humicola]
MKSFLLALLLPLTFFTSSKAQEITPVLWSYAIEKHAGNDTITLRIDAAIATNWYLYAEKEDQDGLSVGLTLKTLRTENCREVGSPQFTKTQSHYIQGLDKAYTVMQERGSIRQRFVRTRPSGAMEIGIEYSALSEDQFNKEGTVVIKSVKMEVQF